MVLAELGKKISSALNDMAKSTVVGDDEVKTMLNTVARALLQADVHISIVKQLQENVRTEVSLSESAGGLNKRKIVQQALFTAVKKMVDPGVKPFTPKKGSPNVIMFVGLQGSGKTTSCTKYAAYWQRKGYKTALLCADTFRAGAYDQLKQNAARVKVRFYGAIAESDPVVIAREGVEALKKEKKEVIIVDTTGRHHQEAALFDEMKQVEEAVKPHDIVYVMDSTNGQALHEQAKEFKAKVKVGSVIITKFDSQNAKGGGALSAVAATSSPVVFIGTGEHFDEFEIFNPSSFVSKMLGFGDVSGLVQSLKDAKIDTNSELYKRFQEGSFTMRDMYSHMENVTKLGSVNKLMEMIPGMSQMAELGAGADGNKTLKGFIHMMDSMSAKELDDPNIRKNMTASRIARIARGSGHSVAEVNNLMLSYAKFEEMAKKMGTVNFKNMGNDPMALMGRQGQAQMAQLAKAMDPMMLKRMGGAGGLQSLMKQVSQMQGGLGGLGM
jgi:signal recognition particle subunit SRP54